MKKFIQICNINCHCGSSDNDKHKSKEGRTYKEGSRSSSGRSHDNTRDGKQARREDGPRSSGTSSRRDDPSSRHAARDEPSSRHASREETNRHAARDEPSRHASRDESSRRAGRDDSIRHRDDSGGHGAHDNPSRHSWRDERHLGRGRDDERERLVQTMCLIYYPCPKIHPQFLMINKYIMMALCQNLLTLCCSKKISTQFKKASCDTLMLRIINMKLLPVLNGTVNISCRYLSIYI